MNRPKTRGECPPPGDACPYVSCRHNLLLEVAESRSTRPTTGPSRGGRRAPRLRLNVLPGNNTGGRRAGLSASARPDEVEAWTERASDRLLEMKETCALRATASNPAGMEEHEIAALLGTTPQAISAELVAIQDKLRARDDVETLDFLFRSR